MKTVFAKTARVAGLVAGAALVLGLSAAPAHAEAGCVGNLLHCVKGQKFADNLTGADIGLPPIAQAKFSNYTNKPQKHTIAVKAGTAIKSQASGDLTFGGSVGVADVKGAVGISVDKTVTTDVTHTAEATIKPGETWYLECFGYYSKYEVALYQRVPGRDNDVLVGARYFYPPVSNALYCRARKK